MASYKFNTSFATMVVDCFSIAVPLLKYHKCFTRNANYTTGMHDCTQLSHVISKAIIGKMVKSKYQEVLFDQLCFTLSATSGF